MKRDYLNIIAAIIVFFMVGMIVFISVVTILRSTEGKNSDFSIKINLSGTCSKDSSRYYLSKAGIDSLNSRLNRLGSQVETLEATKNEILRIRNEEDFYNKIYASIVALIVAMAGFFGFKSMTEIKKQAIEIAEKNAREIADRKSTEIAGEVAQKQVNDKLPTLINILRNTYEVELNKVRDDLQDLKSKVELMQFNEQNLPTNDKKEEVKPEEEIQPSEDPTTPPDPFEEEK